MEKEKGLEIKQMHIKYVYNVDEKREIADKLAQMMQEKAALERDKKRVVSRFTFDINTLDTNMVNLSDDYRQGYTHKDHPCYQVFDFKNRQVFTHRADTHDEVATRTMTVEELQMEFDFSKPDKSEDQPVNDVKLIGCSEDESLLDQMLEDDAIDVEGKVVDAEFDENSEHPEAVQMAIRMKKEHPAQYTQARKELKFKDEAIPSESEAIYLCGKITEILEAEDIIPEESPEDVE